MSKTVERNYLEINSLDDLKETSFLLKKEYTVEFLNPPNFHLNKFFYKNIGKDHECIYRLVCTDKKWIEYTSNKNIKTYIIKKKDDLVGYFELIMHDHQNEVEIAYLGLLKEYQNQKLGSYILSSAIKESFINKIKRVWVHTCSLDHKNALDNYLSRGMKIFKKENIVI